MSLTIIATPGSATANSFVTEAEVIAYMAARLNASAWTTVSGSSCTEDEKKALLEATRELNPLAWSGSRVDTTQALAWPRQWAANPDLPFTSSGYFGTTEIPQRVKDATCELAFQFLNAGTTDLASLPATDGIITKTVDVLSTTYDTNRQRTGLRRFPRIWNLVSPLVCGSSVSVPVVRG